MLWLTKSGSVLSFYALSFTERRILHLTAVSDALNVFLWQAFVICVSRRAKQGEAPLRHARRIDENH